MLKLLLTPPISFLISSVTSPPFSHTFVLKILSFYSSLQITLSVSFYFQIGVSQISNKFCSFNCKNKSIVFK